MPAYQWHGATFDVDASLQDESYLLFEKHHNGVVVASLTVASEETADPLPPYVASSIAALKQDLSGWALVGTPDVGTDAAFIELQGPNDVLMTRSFRRSDDRVFCFTATGQKADAAMLSQWTRSAAESFTR